MVSESAVPTVFAVDHGVIGAMCHFSVGYLELRGSCGRDLAHEPRDFAIHGGCGQRPNRQTHHQQHNEENLLPTQHGRKV